MNKKTILLVAAVLVVGIGGILYRFQGPVLIGIGKTFGIGREIHSDAILVKVTAEELKNESDIVVLGTVLSVESHMGTSSARPGEETVISDASIAVDEYLDNKENLSAREIVVQFLGGEVAGTKMEVDDGPSFKAGERVIAFLKQQTDGTFAVVGWAQGKYTVGADGSVGVGMERLFAERVFGRDVTVDDLRSRLASDTVTNR